MIENLVMTLMPNFKRLSGEFLHCLHDTFVMIGVSGTIAWFLGVILGIILVTTKKNGILDNKIVFTIANKVIDILRSIPFIILMVLLIPLSRFIVGTGSGLQGSFVALVFGTVPFFARQIESVLSDVDKGLIEAADAMGFSKLEIIFSVYLKESIAPIARGTTITIISLIGLTAMAGAVGAGGLGTYAIQSGYYRNKLDIIYVSVILLVILVGIIQAVGNFIVKKATH